MCCGRRRGSRCANGCVAGAGARHPTSRTAVRKCSRTEAAPKHNVSPSQDASVRRSRVCRLMRRCHCLRSASKACRLDTMAWRIILECRARMREARSLRASRRSSRALATKGSRFLRGGGTRNGSPSCHRQRVIRARRAWSSAGACLGVRVGGDISRCRTCCASAFHITERAWSQLCSVLQSTVSSATFHPLRGMEACCPIRECTAAIFSAGTSIW